MANNEYQRLNKKIDSLLNHKQKPLSVTEACEYLGIKKPTLYKLTSQKRIVHFKPNNRLIYFDIMDLEKFAYSNRISSTEEIKEKMKY